MVRKSVVKDVVEGNYGTIINEPAFIMEEQIESKTINHTWSKAGWKNLADEGIWEKILQKNSLHQF